MTSVIILKKLPTSENGKELSELPSKHDVKIFQESFNYFPEDDLERLLHYFEKDSEYLVNKFFQNNYAGQLIYDLYAYDFLDKKYILDNLTNFDISNMLDAADAGSRRKDKILYQKFLSYKFYPIIKSLFHQLFQLGEIERMNYFLHFLGTHDTEFVKKILDSELLDLKEIEKCIIIKFQNNALANSLSTLLKEYVSDESIIEKLNLLQAEIDEEG